MCLRKRMFQPLPKSDGRSTTQNSPRPTCPVSPAVQPAWPPLITEVTQAPVQPTPQGKRGILVLCVALTSWNSTNCVVNVANLGVCFSVSPATSVAAPQAPACQSVTSTGTANPVMSIRHAPPSTVPTVSVTPQPPSNVMTQRVLLSPDMQARLPCKCPEL